ncbi:hypothetical protein BJY04DRAFT_216325 [Aspergillus karnatakaensis]|uniref:uncharacterized protein n=1 Tax=Aspergillus karnatakaensis TaxID=1810916 RepID=UPI003CCE1188
MTGRFTRRLFSPPPRPPSPLAGEPPLGTTGISPAPGTQSAGVTTAFNQSIVRTVGTVTDAVDFPAMVFVFPMTPEDEQTLPSITMQEFEDLQNHWVGLLRGIRIGDLHDGLWLDGTGVVRFGTGRVGSLWEDVSVAVVQRGSSRVGSEDETEVDGPIGVGERGLFQFGNGNGNQMDVGGDDVESESQSQSQSESQYESGHNQVQQVDGNLVVRRDPRDGTMPSLGFR